MEAFDIAVTAFNGLGAKDKIVIYIAPLLAVAWVSLNISARRRINKQYKVAIKSDTVNELTAVRKVLAKLYPRQYKNNGKSMVVDLYLKITGCAVALQVAS